MLTSFSLTFSKYNCKLHTLHLKLPTLVLNNKFYTVVMEKQSGTCNNLWHKSPYMRKHLALFHGAKVTQMEFLEFQVPPSNSPVHPLSDSVRCNSLIFSLPP